jgi:hypothetical protein
MKKQPGRFVVLVCALLAGPVLATLVHAQEVKEKPRMYTYVADWVIPRAQWAEMEKSYVTSQKILDKAMASGTIVGYGNDENLDINRMRKLTTIGGPRCRWRDCSVFWSSFTRSGMRPLLFKSAPPSIGTVFS